MKVMRHSKHSNDLQEWEDIAKEAGWQQDWLSHRIRKEATMSYDKLRVIWSKTESADYFLNQITAGWDKQKGKYWLRSISGLYEFDCAMKEVTLDTGVGTISKPDVKWEIVSE